MMADSTSTLDAGRAPSGLSHSNIYKHISVIVPVRNEEGAIRRTLQQVLAQDYEPGRFDVLVVDGASTDATRDIVRGLQARHPNLMLYGNPRLLSSAARNVGVRQSEGELIVIVDGHCDLEGGHYLRRLAEAFHRSGAD